MAMFYGNTPTARDAFTRTMVNLFDDRDMIGVPQGFQSLFGNPANGSQTIYSPDKNTVQIEIMRGNDNIAALIPRGGVPGFDITNPKLIDPKYSVFQRVFPLIEEESPIRADQLNFAMPGETDEQRLTREQRMQMLALRYVQEQQRRVGRTYEYLASRSALTGKMPALYGSSTVIYDFLRDSNHTVAAGAYWATGTPEAQIAAGVTLVRNDAHVEPDYLIMDPATFLGLRNNEDIKSLADTKRFEMVNIGTAAAVPAKFARMVANGFTYVGQYVTSNGAVLALFIYSAYYTNPSGVSTPYMPVGYALLGSTQARCDRYFGPPEVVPMGPQDEANYRALFGFSLSAPPAAPNPRPGNVFDPNSLFVDAYKDGKNKGYWLRTQAAPIFATTMTDAFVVWTGCAA